MPYLALDFFSLPSLDPQEVGESFSEELGSSSAPHCRAWAAVISVQMDMRAGLPDHS